MAWWKLVVEFNPPYNELTEEDKEHIGNMIKSGFVEGELIQK